MDKKQGLSVITAGRTTLTTATAEALRAAIERGDFPAGSQLPSELELITMLGVSRTTLREALRTLEEQQFITRRRGLGTYVNALAIRKDLSYNFGISEMIKQAGYTPGALDVVLYNEKASQAVADALRIARAAPVVVLERVRTADDVPVVWSRDITSQSVLGEHKIETLQLAQLSFYQYLETYLNIKITHGQAVLKPILASSDLALRLRVKQGSPLLYIAQTDFDAQDHPVLYSIEYHRPDAFEFTLNRRGPNW